jgi:type IV pilus assembly protein PilM
MIRNPFPNAFGLEVGDLSMKLVQLLPANIFNRKTLKLKENREVKLPAGLIVDGEIQQPELVRKKLLYLLGLDKNSKYKKIKTPWVVAGLPEVKTFLKLINIEINPQELNDADVIYQAKKHLPFELDEAYLKWQLIDSKEKYSRVLIGAVPKITADSYTYLLESVGLTPLNLEIEAISLARSMITAEKDYAGEARAILDLGATRSSLIIYDKDTIQFSTSLKYSGEIITTAIEQGLKISHTDAEEMKIKNGVNYKNNNKKSGKYLKIITQINNQLISELESALEFYGAHFSDQNTVSHITMCGGVSNWQGLDNFISRKLKVSSHPGNAWKNLANNKEKYDTEAGVNMAVVVGLALRASQRPYVI